MTVWILMWEICLSAAGPRWAYPVNVCELHGSGQVFRTAKACAEAGLSSPRLGDLGGMRQEIRATLCDKVVL